MKKVSPLFGLLVIAGGLSAELSYNSYWFDGYNVDGADLGFGLAIVNQTATSPRQGAISTVGDVAYVQAGLTSGNDWQVALEPEAYADQGSYLRLAHDLTSVVVSPDHDFSGVITEGVKEHRIGEIVGKKMSFKLGFNGLDATSTRATFTFGASTPLLTSTGLWNAADSVEHSAGGVSVAFRVDEINGHFMQVEDNQSGAGLIANLVQFATVPGQMLVVDIIVDDPTDGDPFDGVGRTQFSVFVDGVNIISEGQFFDLDGTAFTSNFLSIEGSSGGINTTNLHRFDDLTVSAAQPFELWMGYPVVEGWVNTGDWLGLVYVMEDPWIYLDSTSSWVFAPVEGETDTGNWLYIP
ncbi:MAG: hypothetical protein AB3N63_10940 [Puniceicoccaceae bacterium]